MPGTEASGRPLAACSQAVAPAGNQSLAGGRGFFAQQWLEFRMSFRFEDSGQSHCFLRIFVAQGDFKSSLECGHSLIVR